MTAFICTYIFLACLICFIVVVIIYKTNSNSLTKGPVVYKDKGQDKIEICEDRIKDCTILAKIIQGVDASKIFVFGQGLWKGVLLKYKSGLRIFIGARYGTSSEVKKEVEACLKSIACNADEEDIIVLVSIPKHPSIGVQAGEFALSGVQAQELLDAVYYRVFGRSFEEVGELDV